MDLTLSEEHPSRRARVIKIERPNGGGFPRGYDDAVHGNSSYFVGGYGYSTEYDVERYFRDAPLMIVGEGTNEIQRNVIAAQLVKRGGLTVHERPRSHSARSRPLVLPG